MANSRKATTPSKSDIRKKIDQASKEALKLLEKRARTILRKNPQLDEFIMAMGSANFTRHDGEYESLWGDPYAKPVCDLLDEFDNELHLTGNPMRFTATGPVRTDW